MDRDTVIALARQVWGQTAILPTADLERFAALIKDHLTWSDIHTCSPGCTKPSCVSMRKAEAHAAAVEREACAYRAGIALLGADRGLANRVDQAIRSRT